MAAVELRGIDKVFDDGTRAVRNLSLSVAEGEFLALLGPSGCGKSTLLRVLAGLEEVSAGEIFIGDRMVNDLGPLERDVAMVFQNYALYPHMTVRGNLEFPLRMRKRPRAEVARRVEQIARMLGLDELLARKPRQLSGGQAQRVAMGRALVREPAVFLMDEPLSNLDAKLRVQIRREIAAVHERTRTTTLYVTHDQVEAMTLGQRVAVLSAGELQQAAAPQALYERPANIFVAGFVGRPPMNIFEAVLREEAGTLTLTFGSSPIPVPPEVTPSSGGRASVRLAGLRPEAFAWPEERSTHPRIQATVQAVEALGHEQIVHFPAPVRTIEADRAPEIVPTAADRALMAARLSTRRSVRPGETLSLAVSAGALYWFDERGRALERPRDRVP
ncbi:MAG: ATP-binding cassette domain-containing protein [Gammaproteobacteria bacterium]|nr:ATP-binding cassette domain-containing protein [Gammaproteobacteria bacterium]NIR84059.1 ATP-binding cassette domain-containing protein [Gammaproteobacteria bacterium]NIR89203.1 ATP-binding cassette domain-containing protein [Gammaproteobacteria bacterium]NIU05005.1 ATP-binding cassette domain-containing protein [Gammaproteobacteria bacterium]NIV52171.1 ATP-binding cassette domain-containing protein [Gammaproteobacteria bacterium]